MDPLHALYERLHGADRDDAQRAARELGERGNVVAVSACLLGEKVRYDGGDKLDPDVLARLRGRTVLPICPEMLAGLGTPRPAIHFLAGDGDALLDGTGAAIDQHGRDAGPALCAGAERAAELVGLAGARQAILKQRSPSCGLAQVHSAAGLVPGRGCFAARLVRAGLDAEDEGGKK